MRAMFLAADVGGTKTLLALFRAEKGRLVEIRSGEYASAEHPSFEAIAKAFLEEGKEKPRRAAVGVAGPVVGGKSRVVNVKWPVEEKKVARALGLDRVAVLNDLEATGWGLPELPAKKIRPLTKGLRPKPGNAALIAAGTGLGMCILHWDGTRHLPAAGEGGHQDLAPRDALEYELLRFLQKRHGRVSVERVVAGPGMGAIYDFLVETGRGTRSLLLDKRFEKEDRNAVVSEAGVARQDATAARAVEIFVSLYGAAAGNLALVAKAVGGVWVGGGIAPKILPALERGLFLESFRAKGRMRPLLSEIPVKVILEPRTALLGAAAYAARELSPPRRRRPS